MDQEPKQVITEFLFDDEWTNAKAGTIHFLQQRSLPHSQIYAVTFDNKKGQQRWLCIVIQDEQGHWYLQSAGPLGEAIASSTRNYPWVNLAAGNSNIFWAGGSVITRGFDVKRVRLISTKGEILEDTVQDNLVMFLSSQPLQWPLQVELHDAKEAVVGSHTFPLPHTFPLHFNPEV